MRPELFTIPGTSITVPSFGAMVMIGFLGALWWMTRRATKVKQDPDLVLNFGFIALFFMALGARTFYVIHYWDSQFKYNPSQIFNLRAGGFEFYGGLIGAFVPCILYAWYKGLSLRLWTDLVAPSLLFGMGVGRIGCFLAGCCYGTTCSADLPWAMQFPYGSEAQIASWEARTTAVPADLMFITKDGNVLLLAPKAAQEIASGRKQLDQHTEQARARGETDKVARLEKASAQLKELEDHMAAHGLTPARLESLRHDPHFSSPHVHPAQLYSAVGPLLLAWLMNAYFYRRKRHGTVFALAMMLYAVERFIEESLRADNPVDTLGLTVSQAISVGVFVLMAAYLLLLQRLPLRSPRAVAYVPKDARKTDGAEPATA